MVSAVLLNVSLLVGVSSGCGCVIRLCVCYQAVGVSLVSGCVIRQWVCSQAVLSIACYVSL